MRNQQPAPAIHTFTDGLRERAQLNINQVPDGYFCVVGELLKLLYVLEANLKQALDQGAILENSVGHYWAIYARCVLGIADHRRRHYTHRCQDGRTVRAWAYPIESVQMFDRWFWNVYVPEHLPRYQRYRRVKIGQPHKAMARPVPNRPQQLWLPFFQELA